MKDKLTEQEQTAYELFEKHGKVHVDNIVSYINEKKMAPNIAIAVLISILKSVIDCMETKVQWEMRDHIINVFKEFKFRRDDE